MIPKIIHYCWFSEGEKPEKIQKCIQSWSKYLPDYEIKCWNYKNFPKGKSKWVDEAVNAQKFAFAADYIRAYALYHEGGIYLDSDVEVLKDLSSLLKLPYFIGAENQGIWEAAVMGAEAKMKLFGKLLEYYDSREFRTRKGYDTTPLPKILHNIGRNEYNIVELGSISEFDLNTPSLQILPFDYFSPKSYKTGVLTITNRTFTIHHFTASWHGKKEWLFESIQKLLGIKAAKILSKIYKKMRFI